MSDTWMEQYLKPMVGGKIIAVGVSEDGFPWFRIEHPEHGILTVEVSQDGEGNGPGFLFGLPREEPSGSKGGT